MATGEPRADVPYMPQGYGEMLGSRRLAWSWAQQRLEAAHNLWLATTRPDGRPHAMPVWGVWLDDAFYFSTGRGSRKERNLGLNANCVIGCEDAAGAVVVEAVAEEVEDVAAMAPMLEAYRLKYSWPLEPSLGPIFKARPRVAFGFVESAGEGAGATRWTFEG